jgi:hypothetical protein
MNDAALIGSEQCNGHNRRLTAAEGTAVGTDRLATAGLRVSLECGDSSPLFSRVAALRGSSDRSTKSGDESPHSKPCGPVPRRVATLLVCTTILLLGLLWWFDPAEAHLPMCTFHVLTGLQCPGCGATRATHELLHGRLLAAWHYNALWVLMLPAVVYAAASEMRLLAGRRPLPGDLPRRPWFWVAVVAAAMVFFVVRNLPWADLYGNFHGW